MLFMGTSVVEGKGQAVVTATGMQTELGRIAGMIQQIPEETTPLQQKLDVLGRQLVIISLVLVAVVFASELLRGAPCWRRSWWLFRWRSPLFPRACPRWSPLPFHWEFSAW